eukprot:COSAG05_NODE_1281_length_5287_cov_51.775636_3_plen_150_part_00
MLHLTCGRRMRWTEHTVRRRGFSASHTGHIRRSIRMSLEWCTCDVASSQSTVKFRIFLHMRATAIPVCNLQISYRPRTAVIYGRCGRNTQSRGRHRHQYPTWLASQSVCIRHEAATRPSPAARSVAARVGPACVGQGARHSCGERRPYS